jgi:hypothetical protein
LHELQDRFEKSPMDFKKAYDLFQALNQYEMYTSVVRLYFKHDLKVNSSLQLSLHNQDAKLMQSQYEYAKDHI